MRNSLHIVAAHLTNDARVKSYVKMLRRLGWQTDVICYKESKLPLFEEGEGLRVYRVTSKYQGSSVLQYIKTYMHFYLAAKKLATHLHKKRSYNFVHVHNMPNFIIGIARSLSPKVPIILDMHDLMSVNFMTKFKSNCFAGQVIAYEEKWSISKATKLVCADRGQKQVLTRLHYNKDPIVIMNLADEDLFRWSDHSWIGGPFRFVYHGTIAWRLGVDRVIEALRNLPEHIVFRLIGDGDEKESIVNMIHAYSLNNRVEVLPIVPVEELPGLLSDCHAGVIPSRRTEATNSAMLPVKLLEYTSLGIPSVVSKLDNISLHFREDQAAFFQPESQTDLKRAMSEITISKTMRSRILRGIQDFNIANRWQHGAETYMRVVNEITS